MMKIKHEAEERHVLTVMVDNEAGILAKIAGLFTARGYNIDSLTVADISENHQVSRITIVTHGPPEVIDQIHAQLERLVPVHKVVDLTEVGPYVERELALIKVAGKGDVRVEALRVATLFPAQTLGLDADLVIINGLGFEGWLERLVKASGTKAPTVIASKGIKPLERAASDGHSHGRVDPHAWQSVANVKIYVGNIRDALDCYCTGGNWCYVAVHSAGNLQIGYALSKYGDSVRNNIMLERRSNGWVVVGYSLRADDEQTRRLRSSGERIEEVERADVVGIWQYEHTRLVQGMEAVTTFGSGSGHAFHPCPKFLRAEAEIRRQPSLGPIRRATSWGRGR